MRGDYSASQEKPYRLSMARQSRGKEHIGTILNRPVPLQTPDMPESEEEIDISKDPIKVER